MNQTTLADVVEKHRWRSVFGRPFDVFCTGCAWTVRIQNTGKTAIRLHAEHVEQVWSATPTVGVDPDWSPFDADGQVKPDDELHAHGWVRVGATVGQRHVDPLFTRLDDAR